MYKNNWICHPKPQQKRKNFFILNENWKLNGSSVCIPFPPQSKLSEYAKSVEEAMCYETEFFLPDCFEKERVLLHFGAVDQIAEVWLNEEYVGKHEGGYLPFSFDITSFIKKEGKNKLVVNVIDTLSKDYPYGKQKEKRGGMWYTPVSGIWQSVWLENVPDSYIKDIFIKPDLSGINIRVEQTKKEQVSAIIFLENGEKIEKCFEEGNGYISLAEHVNADKSVYQPKLWSPDTPFLYKMIVKTMADEVETYFALRTIEIKKISGINRVCLNGKPIFLHGVLDQGYFPEGIYLPSEPQEYERDILRMKELGFNLLRKHIKVEPESFYYFCDKHGMLVMQDMVNSGTYNFLRDTALPTIGMKRKKDTRGRDSKRKQFFREHTKQTIRQLYNHPCIVAYTIFNEGWGQFNSDEMYDYVKALDDSRLVDSTSGWFWQEKSDFDSEHIYFRTVDLNVKERPLLVSECGGYSRVIKGHCYNEKKVYGYGKAEDEKMLTDMIVDMYKKMILPGIAKGVCGCVYTQLSDVEDEVNGLYTYDRKICKVNKEMMLSLANQLKIVENRG